MSSGEFSPLNPKNLCQFNAPAPPAPDAATMRFELSGDAVPAFREMMARTGRDAEETLAEALTAYRAVLETPPAPDSVVGDPVISALYDVADVAAMLVRAERAGAATGTLMRSLAAASDKWRALAASRAGGA